MKIPQHKYADSREVDVCDAYCAGRVCLWVVEDKGTFVQGRGYVSYYRTPELVCWTRHLHGCPSPLPPPEPALLRERLRCCEAPAFSRRKRVGVRRQRCRTCGAMVPVRVARLFTEGEL